MATMNDLHDLDQWSDQALKDRAYLIGQFKTSELWEVIRHQCDDFEVDDGKLVRDCVLNDDDALLAELKRRDEK